MTSSPTIALVERARHGWPEVPDWVLELARACEQLGQSEVARRVGYSPSVISQTISNTYEGSLSAVETKVRGAILKEVIQCPVVGEMRKDKCMSWQKKPAATRLNSPLNMRMYRACRSGCVHSRIKKDLDR